MSRKKMYLYFFVCWTIALILIIVASIFRQLWFVPLSLLFIGVGLFLQAKYNRCPYCHKFLNRNPIEGYCAYCGHFLSGDEISE